MPATVILPTVDLADAAHGAGFTGPDLVTAVAVALAESGGNAHAYNGNVTTGDNSYGLWQINMIGALGPARRHQFGIASNDELFLPATNARAAFRIFTAAGHRFTDWSTYQHNLHRSHLGEAADAVSALRAGTGSGSSQRVLTRLLRLAQPMLQGDDVHDCQVVLGCPADGVFGPITRGHVVGWQHLHGLSADGVVGARTAASFGWTFAG